MPKIANWLTSYRVEFGGCAEAAAPARHDRNPVLHGAGESYGVDAVTSNFANGLNVQIMQVGVPWARQVLQQYFPADEPPEEKAGESDDLAIHCPKCHSTEVVFEDLDRGPRTRMVSLVEIQVDLRLVRPRMGR